MKSKIKLTQYNTTTIRICTNIQPSVLHETRSYMYRRQSSSNCKKETSSNNLWLSNIILLLLSLCNTTPGYPLLFVIYFCNTIEIFKNTQFRHKIATILVN